MTDSSDVSPVFVASERPVSHTEWSPQSLVWEGEDLVDWLAGANRYHLDGRFSSGGVSYRYRFDAVATLPGSPYTVLYERLGTKGLVLHGLAPIREIGRSFYHADVYDHPLTMFRLADGREAIAYAPDAYNRLEIELLATGERLTTRPDGSPEPKDFFHSGLEVAPGGTWLMSAGWIWHPFYSVNFYPLEAALRAPRLLDQDSRVADPIDIASAVFLDGERAVLASTPEADGDPDAAFGPGMIGIYRPATRSWESKAVLGEIPGRLLVVDSTHVLSLYEHPKLIHVPSGRIVERWPHIASGTWDGCIGQDRQLPPMAWDPVRRRLAVAMGDAIWILAPSTPASV